MPILNDRQQQLIRDLVRLCESAQHKSFMYTPSFNNKDNIAAHGTSVKASASEKELKTLEHEGMIALKWVRHGAANGTVLQDSFDAVRNNFAGMGDPTAVAPPPSRGAPAAAPPRTNFIPMREGAAPHAPPIPGRGAAPAAAAPAPAGQRDRGMQNDECRMQNKDGKPVKRPPAFNSSPAFSAPHSKRQRSPSPPRRARSPRAPRRPGHAAPPSPAPPPLAPGRRA